MSSIGKGSLTLSGRAIASFRLEAVITCVNYGDFLKVTLLHNLHHFDRIVVVTTHEDRETQEVCRANSIECVRTDAFTEGGRSFQKGAAINIGLAHLQQDSWVLHLDADVILPDNFRQQLMRAGLERDCIYGADRLHVVGEVGYRELVKHRFFQRQHGYRYVINVPPLPLGHRFVHVDYGFLPIGFFQLWWGPQEMRYPTVQQDGAEHTDVLFSLQWPRNKRHIVPNIVTFHIDSEPAALGANWHGRTTRRFNP